MDFEAGMLLRKSEDEGECRCSTVQDFDSSIIERTHVHTAHFKTYERDIKLLCIENGGNKNLKDAYRDLSLVELQQIGRAGKVTGQVTRYNTTILCVQSRAQDCGS
jgi:hypothetical protein